MAKDRDQLTPAESDDRNRIRPLRSAAREVVDALDSSTGPGPGSSHSDPKAVDEVDAEEEPKYR